MPSITHSVKESQPTLHVPQKKPEKIDLDVLVNFLKPKTPRLVNGVDLQKLFG